MNTDRMTRVNELLRRVIGEMLFQIPNCADVDLSTITVTHVITSRNLRHARVLVSIRDTPEKRKQMLHFLRESRPEMQRRINSELSLKFTPKLTFELDISIEKGDQVLTLISQLEIPESEEGGGETEPLSEKEHGQ
jgi:ribosome-binding factor A